MLGSMSGGCASKETCAKQMAGELTFATFLLKKAAKPSAGE